jgi:glycosyltransferase involved in cell wall biosynthesis
MGELAVGGLQMPEDEAGIPLRAANRQLPARVAMLTPLPPAKSGVAHYASMILPALGKQLDIRAFESLEGYRRGDFDEVIYQLGNNPYHETMYAEAMREPGVIVLHDLVLHHLIVELTLARGDVDGYVAALRASHGEAGAAWARGRAAGLHSEMGNFLLPASVEVANRSRAVIVHNAYARTRLRSLGVTTPIHVVPHPYVPERRTMDRADLGLREDQRVIGFFGFLTSAKRAEVVLEAFHAARRRDPRLVLLIVGEPAPNIDAASLRGDGVVTTGYVADEDFAKYYSVADRFVNLRYPTAGETSGTLIRALDSGKPVAVSDYAQFAELPDQCVCKIPLGQGEKERLAEFFLSDLASPATAQRAWLDEHATVEKTVEGYLCALGGETRPRESAAVPGQLILFPSLAVVSASFGEQVTLSLRNDGAATIPTRTYGQPEYRLIAKLFDGEQEVQDQWLSLPCDLEQGGVVTIELPRRAARATSLRLYHALQDVPVVDGSPWERIDVR